MSLNPILHLGSCNFGTYDSDPNNEETNQNTNNGEKIAANKRPRRNEDAQKKITVIEI